MSIYIMTRMFRAPLGSSSRKIMAVRLADFADDDGRGIWPTVARLARETELSERTVQRILADFVAEGLLMVVAEASGRPGQATRYDFDMAAVERLSATGDTMTPVKGVTPATQTGDTDDGDGCHHDTRTVIEPPIEPSGEREGASEREEGDDPSKFFDRVRLMELGAKGSPRWEGAQGSSTQWAVQQFAKLTDAERRQAEENRDAYLASCPRDRAGNPKPVAIGVYFRDKKFQAVEKPRPAGAPVASVDGRIIVPVLGPIWAAAAFLPLLGRSHPVNLPVNHRQTVIASYEVKLRINPQRAADYLAAKGITIGADGKLVFPADFERNEERLLRMAEGYPEANRLYEAAREGGDVKTDHRFEGLKAAMEFVPSDGAVMEDWRAFYAERFIPFPPLGRNGGYFPMGGPGRIEEFRQAVSAAMQRGTQDDAA